MLLHQLREHPHAVDQDTKEYILPLHCPIRAAGPVVFCQLCQRVKHALELGLVHRPFLHGFLVSMNKHSHGTMHFKNLQPLACLC